MRKPPLSRTITIDLSDYTPLAAAANEPPARPRQAELLSNPIGPSAVVARIVTFPVVFGGQSMK